MGCERTCLWLAILPLVVGAATATAQERAFDQSVYKFPCLDGVERDRVISNYSRDRKGLIHWLLTTLDEEQKKRRNEREPWFFLDGPEQDAVLFLGLLRAPEAVERLFERIEVDVPVFYPRTMAVFPDTTVIRALINIGKPASQKAVKLLAEEDSKSKINKYVRVIAQIEGMELGQELIKLAAKNEKEEKRKQRLLQALDFFKDADKPISDGFSLEEKPPKAPPDPTKDGIAGGR